MKGRSCLTNVLDFFEEVCDELDTNNPVDLMPLDFAKAFERCLTKINKKDARMWNKGRRNPMDHQVAKKQATKSEDQRERLTLDKRHKRSASRVITGTTIVCNIYQRHR